MNKKIITIYSINHFIIDLASAILIFNFVNTITENGFIVSIAVLLYNFFAFAMQLPLGIIADNLNKNALFSAIGCFIIIIAYFLFELPIVSCILAGIGNAMFHLGGGIDVLNISKGKATLSGIFVSTGAMGIFLGSRIIEYEYLYWNIIFILLISSISLLLLYKNIKGKNDNLEVKIPNLRKKRTSCNFMFNNNSMY